MNTLLICIIHKLVSIMSTASAKYVPIDQSRDSKFTDCKFHKNMGMDKSHIGGLGFWKGSAFLSILSYVNTDSSAITFAFKCTKKNISLDFHLPD